MGRQEAIVGEEFSPEKSRFSLLSARVLQSLERYPNIGEEGRQFLTEAEEFFEKALRGSERVETLRAGGQIAVNEVNTYYWALITLAQLPTQITQIETKADVQQKIPAILEESKAMLEALQSSNTTEVGPEKIVFLRTFFEKMNEIATKVDSESTNRIGINLGIGQGLLKAA